MPLRHKQNHAAASSSPLPISILRRLATVGQSFTRFTRRLVTRYHGVGCPPARTAVSQTFRLS